MLERFIFKKFVFALKFQEEAVLPRFKSATLRGGFGYQFKKTVCIKKDKPDCESCSFKHVCVYSYIFETSPPAASTKLQKIKDIPRPFVVNAPLDGKFIYKKNEFLPYDLVLIGKATDYLPYFVLVFKELGKSGLGKDRSGFSLEKIEVVEPDSSYMEQKR